MRGGKNLVGLLRSDFFQDWMLFLGVGVFYGLSDLNLGVFLDLGSIRFSRVLDVACFGFGHLVL